MKIHLATDHAGLELKNSIKEYLADKGHDITDHGAYEYDWWFMPGLGNGC